MKKQNQVRPGLPPDARAEILEALGANMETGKPPPRDWARSRAAQATGT